MFGLQYMSWTRIFLGVVVIVVVIIAIASFGNLTCTNTLNACKTNTDCTKGTHCTLVDAKKMACIPDYCHNLTNNEQNVSTGWEVFSTKLATGLAYLQTVTSPCRMFNNCSETNVQTAPK